MPSTFEAAPPVIRPATPGTGGGRILVVDDTEANRDLLARRLRREGHVVDAVESGPRALERVRGEPFDLVLLDIMMPEMSGYDVLAALKGDPALRHIPVIMITAIDEIESVVRCIELGAEDHLPKPFNPTLLRARIGASLAKKRLHDREQVHARSLERELEIGRNIQSSFLPERLPLVAGWEISVCFRPARQVAGDFYDAFALPGSDRVVVAVADVCGKGIGAAVFMAAFRTLMHALAEHSTLPVDDADALARLVRFVNDYVAITHERANMFTTLFVATLDPRDGALSYVNAGHDPPIVRRADGRIERLAPTGPAVGMLPGLDFRVDRVTLGAGDVLLAVTDGVVDARGAHGESFTESRLLAHLTPAAVAGPGGAATLVAGIEADVIAHVGDAEQFDDVTMLALRRESFASLGGAGR
jgi:serine phosphatase RsbU (regulator of sigma subunit)